MNKYKVIIKQIDIVEVNAYSKEEAIQQVKNSLKSNMIVEVEIVEDGEINEQQTNQ